MMKKISIWLVIFTLVAAPAFADGGQCMQKCMGKAGDGLTNLALGWTEIFTEPYDAGKKGDNVLVGLGKGLWNAVGDTVGGAINLVTFFIPKATVPLPEGGIDWFKK